MYLGASIFKITRLLVIAIFCVHFFACIFFKVKEESAESPSSVSAFYTSMNIDENVQCFTRISFVSS